MYKVHKPHLTSGYLESVRYEATTDAEGHPDWVMSYVPGPKAHAEYAAFNARSGRASHPPAPRAPGAPSRPRRPPPPAPPRTMC